MQMQEYADRTILFITRKWPPAMGGMETYCWELAQRLGRLGLLTVIALPGRKGGSVPTMPAMLWFGLSTSFRLLTRKPASVAHIGDLAIWPLAWIAKLRGPKTKIVISLHGSDVNFANGQGIASRMYKAYIRLGARLLKRTRLVANSEWIASLARAHGYSDIIIVPLATTLKADKAPVDHNGALLFAGRITPSKGLGFIVRQVLPLLDGSVRIRVAGSIWDQREAELLKHPQVEYLGVLGSDQLAAEYAQAMCVLVPSQTSEGFGLVAAEAAACGGVVIASAHSGLAEVVAPELGFVADAYDAAAWAKRIQLIAGWKADERTRFTSAAMAFAQRKYDWDRVAAETVAAYR
ncbi:glycosyltransferase [Sphingorhabdus pulchriflava]|uniref:Glycosyltransferase n=1 Tax=Sphingorhabdus pulchriflava TaxID=2292257 RepID=A0A371B1Q5_9SPHN|nr:glycosyltransferase family 4 protein [Sphingorhabdus pulchriflava]RDV01488.1 glycosyltransferase [Sphingorhabdus pulchriflava]